MNRHLSVFIKKIFSHTSYVLVSLPTWTRHGEFYSFTCDTRACRPSVTWFCIVLHLPTTESLAAVWQRSEQPAPVLRLLDAPERDRTRVCVRTYKAYEKRQWRYTHKDIVLFLYNHMCNTKYYLRTLVTTNARFLFVNYYCYFVLFYRKIHLQLIIIECRIYFGIYWF